MITPKTKILKILKYCMCNDVRTNILYSIPKIKNAKAKKSRVSLERETTSCISRITSEIVYNMYTLLLILFQLMYIHHIHFF